MEFLDKQLFHVGDSSVTVLSVLVFGLILIISILFAVLIKKALTKKIFPKYQIQKGVARAWASIVNYFIIIIGILTGLNLAGVHLSVLFAGGAALLVGIGFGIQNIVNNFISGIILLFEKSVKEGDFIEVDGMYGTVCSIAMRCTILETTTGVTVIVPNSKLLEQKVINRSYNPKTEIDIPVIVPYECDIEKVKSILLKIASENSIIIDEPKPSVSVSEFTDRGIKLSLLVWITEQKRFLKMRSDINLRILEEFNKEGIKMPYPVREMRNNE